MRIERALGGAGGAGGIAQRAGGVFVQLRPVVVVRLAVQQFLVAEQVLAVGQQGDERGALGPRKPVKKNGWLLELCRV